MGYNGTIQVLKQYCGTSFLKFLLIAVLISFQVSWF
jgi:hypothetical protein